MKKKILAGMMIATMLMTACSDNKDSKSEKSVENVKTEANKDANKEAVVTDYIYKEFEEKEIVSAVDAETLKKDISGVFECVSDNESGIKVNGDIYTITSSGEYTFKGNLNNGQVIVDAGDEDEVTIILSGAKIANDKSASIKVQNAKNVKIKLEEDTYNEVIDLREEMVNESDNSTEGTENGDENNDENNDGAAIYSVCDLDVCGKGALLVSAASNNGIHTKGDLNIKNATIKVSAVNNALKGNDSVDIESGEIILTSQKGNGIKTKNSDVSSKGNQRGNISIEGGNIDIFSVCDGIDAAYDVNISGDGNININTGNNSNDSQYSAKGIKSANNVYINGFYININSADDGIHANSEILENEELGQGNIKIDSGYIVIASADDGIHADNNLEINEGIINIKESYEGLEGNQVLVNGGTIFVNANDDAVNACTGSTTPLVKVTDGYLDVTTPSGDTDAIDSNGNYEQSGGFVFIKGGSSQGMMAGSLDVDGKVTVTGGGVFALGGICETPEDSCNAYVMNGISFTEGEYLVKDSDDNIIFNIKLEGNYSSAWICADKLITGTEYEISRQGEIIDSWTQENGTMGENNMGGFGFGGPGGNREKDRNGGYGGPEGGEFSGEPQGNGRPEGDEFSRGPGENGRPDTKK